MVEEPIFNKTIKKNLNLGINLCLSCVFIFRSRFSFDFLEEMYDMFSLGKTSHLDRRGKSVHE